MITESLKKLNNRATITELEINDLGQIELAKLTELLDISLKLKTDHFTTLCDNAIIARLKSSKGVEAFCNRRDFIEGYNFSQDTLKTLGTLAYP